MAVNYTYEYRSASESFPNVIPDIIEYKDVDSSVASVVMRIEGYIKANDYETANSIIQENAALLSNYIISAADINRIIEDIRNTQIYGMEKSQDIFFMDTMPLFVVTNDVWVGGGSVV